MQPLASPSLTAGDRDFLIGQLEDSSAKFLAAIAGIPPGPWTFKPDPDTWSVAENADHVVVVERRLRGLIRKILAETAAPEKAEAVAGKEKYLLRAVLDRSRRVKVPEPMEPTGRSETPEQIAELFREVRASTIDYVRTSQDPVRHHFAPHFALGDLDGAQWLLMISLHTARHVLQIDEVKASPGYPAS